MIEIILQILIGKRSRRTTAYNDTLEINDSWPRWGINRESSVEMWTPEFYNWVEEEGRFHVLVIRSQVGQQPEVRILMQRERRGKHYYWYGYVGLPRRWVEGRTSVRKYVGKLERFTHNPDQFWAVMHELAEAYDFVMNERSRKIRLRLRNQWRRNARKRRALLHRTKTATR